MCSSSLVTPTAAAAVDVPGAASKLPEYAQPEKEDIPCYIIDTFKLLPSIPGCLAAHNPKLS